MGEGARESEELTTRCHPILAAGSFPLTGGAFCWASANYSDCLTVNGVVCNKGFRDASQQEREVYEDPDWARRMAELWSKLSPLYQQLHTYVRRRLYEYYGPRRIRLDGPLPAHVLGNYLRVLENNISERANLAKHFSESVVTLDKFKILRKRQKYFVMEWMKNTSNKYKIRIYLSTNKQNLDLQ